LLPGNDFRQKIHYIDSEIRNHYYGILNIISRAEFNTKPLFSTWINADETKSRFGEDRFYSIHGIDRIMKAVRAERSSRGALVASLELRSRGQSIERENSTGFKGQGDTDFTLEKTRLEQSEIMFFSDLFLLKTTPIRVHYPSFHNLYGCLSKLEL
jgi:hypothetical protein